MKDSMDGRQYGGNRCDGDEKGGLSLGGGKDCWPEGAIGIFPRIGGNGWEIRGDGEQSSSGSATRGVLIVDALYLFARVY
jgi:hypothetical protein